MRSSSDWSGAAMKELNLFAEPHPLYRTRRHFLKNVGNGFG